MAKKWGQKDGGHEGTLMGADLTLIDEDPGLPITA
jgi:hypothetical protein